ncbi:hypothetical protein VC83_04764 [Pseudogymnoascus destructans]|uniref:VanZ-like domain-containing protein n=2 Tax=Pseudogymnoascus destructans TaxID=655981 RepID=L8FVL2_PSED2|nr:uncharacterized protein VC83_04764 [Pseudogymnoascus destructans]ELR03786.1 hypothetical protein GMDG_01315 [Pseudogymnoascus destructans 20631-21]OAF57565.1 hypothetical protein VC83_04764 [Pseudogymnoascus destructans]
MRIRLPFAGAFLILLLGAAYLGLSSLQLGLHINDKALHTLTFFLLTLCFYWILDTSRRRTLNLTLSICTFLLGIGSEFLQALLPNGRDFDAYDILANVLGSLAAVGLSTWYHKRMVERKRLRKNYTAVPGEDGDMDLELGEGSGAQESGVVPGHTAPAAVSLEEEVDAWDENAEDTWEEDDAGVVSPEGKAGKAPSASSRGDEGEGKKRAD